MPLRVKMLEAKILEISSSSFKNQAVSSALTRLASRSNMSQTLLSLADFNEIAKKLVNSFLLLADWPSM